MQNCKYLHFYTFTFPTFNFYGNIQDLQSGFTFSNQLLFMLQFVHENHGYLG